MKTNGPLQFRFGSDAIHSTDSHGAFRLLRIVEKEVEHMKTVFGVTAYFLRELVCQSIYRRPVAL